MKTIKKIGIVLFFVICNCIVYSQNNKQTQKHPMLTKDIEIQISKIVYPTSDTIFNSYLAVDSQGWFDCLKDQTELDEYIYSRICGNYWFGLIDPYCNFRFNANYVNKTDTLRSFLQHHVYYKNGDYIRDTSGVTELSYDLESSYILNQMHQTVSDKYIYSMITSGTWRKGFDDPYSVLYKIDVSQDTTYNVYNYEAKSVDLRGMQLVSSDSIIVPLKKWYFRKITEDANRLYNLSASNVISIDNSKYSVLIIKDKRFIVRNQYPVKMELWAELTEGISFYAEKLGQKQFKKKKK